MFVEGRSGTGRHHIPLFFLFLKKKKKTSLENHHPPNVQLLLRKIYTTQTREKDGNGGVFSTLYTHLVCVRIILPVGYFRVNRFFPLKKKKYVGDTLKDWTDYQIPQQQQEEDSSSSSEGSKCAIVFLAARWPVDNFQMETKSVNRIALFTFFLLLVFFTLFDQ